MTPIDAALEYQARQFIRDHRSLAVEVGRLIAQEEGRPLPQQRQVALTPSQKELLEFIRFYTRAHGGISPSFGEMAEYLGQHSKSGIHRLVTALEERGFIRRLESRARSIVIIGEAA